MILDTGSIQGLSLNNLYFENVTSLENRDKTGSILLINSWDLNSQNTIAINNVTFEKSSMNFILFGTFSNTPPATKQLSITNFEYRNSFIETQRKLINTEGVEVDEDLILKFENIAFSNVSFYTVGSLISFGHQLPNTLQMDNLTLTNIVAGRLHVESTNQQNTNLLTQVSINNSTFDNINDQFSSLIITEQGSRLNVTSSSFTNIYTFEEGAVVFAGPTGTEVNFFDTVFQNNSAVTGALFHIESESVVRCYNCTMTDNAAFVSTIADVANNGYFEFYRSRIYNNYAYQIPVTEILDSRLVSVIDSCEMYSNHDLFDTWVTETTSTCNKLCFVPSELAQYYNTSGVITLAETENDALFQVISSSLRLQNSTYIHDQNSIVNLFLSDLYVTDSIIENIDMITVAFGVTSSTFVLQSTALNNISSSSNTELLFANLNSSITLDASNFTRFGSSVLRSTNSNVTMNSLLIDYINTNTNIIQISRSELVRIDRLQVLNVTLNAQYIVFIKESTNTELLRFILNNQNETMLGISQSTINLVADFNITD